MVQDAKVFFRSIDDVKMFCDICNTYDFSIDLYTGRYVVSAKSIMGIFSLDISKPITMKADCDEDSEFMALAEQFIVS